METLKPYHYTECGLENVFLDGGVTIEKDGSVFIQDIHGLHRCIARMLVFSGRRLTGKEIRFMRHYMDLSQKALGEILGVDYQSVLRWENEKTKISRSAENLLRGLLYEYATEDGRACEIIRAIADLDRSYTNETEQKIELERQESGWAKAA